MLHHGLGVGGLSANYEEANLHQHSSEAYEEEPVEDDAQTKFYKRHMTRAETPHSSGRTPIYNFDEWSAAHYGKAFERKQNAQRKYRTNDEKFKRESDGIKSEIVIFSILMGFVSFLFISFQLDSVDKAVTKKK